MHECKNRKIQLLFETDGKILTSTVGHSLLYLVPKIISGASTETSKVNADIISYVPEYKFSKRKTDIILVQNYNKSKV